MRPATDQLWQLTTLFAATLTAMTAPHVSAQSPTQEASSTPSSTLPMMAIIGPSFRFAPYAELSERYSDNATHFSSETARSDWVSDLATGVHIDYRGSQANALIDYRINRLFYRHLPSLDTTVRNLNASATLEPVARWLFVDARANISQQSRSAFGAAGTADVSSANSNRVETETYQISPTIRGTFRDLASYQVRMNVADTLTGEAALPSTRTHEFAGRLNNSKSAGILGWSVDASKLFVENSAIGKKYDSKFRTTGTFAMDAQLHLSVSVGKEYSDFDSQLRRTSSIHGMGVEWAPSQRTSLAAISQRRFFGYDHIVAFSHRTALTEWRFSSSREAAVSSNELSATSPTSVSSLLQDLLAASIPDPIGRAEAVQRRIEQTGLPTASGIQLGLLSLRPTIQARQDASVVLLGARNAVTISAGRYEQRAIDNGTISSSSASIAPIEPIRQLQANMTWAYRLSPVSTLRLTFSHLQTKDIFNERLTTTQRLQSLSFVSQLGQNVSLSLGLQRSQFDSTVVTSFRENIILSTLSLRF